MKHLKLIVVLVAMIAFVATGFAIAQSGTKAGGEFYIVKGADGKMAVADKKPADAKSVVKGPFKTKKDAEAAMKAAAKAGSASKPAAMPDEGC